MTPDDLSRSIATAARQLQEELGSQHTMERTVQLTKELVPGCERAGITLVRCGQLVTPAAGDEVVIRVDELQYQYRQGPCVDALSEQELAHSRDIAADPRWPEWGPRAAAETGVRSMMCFRLFTTHDTLGALNMYAATPGAFDETDLEHGLALAAHAALAVAASMEIETLRAGLDYRTVIGQATGILMQRYDLDPDVAFSILKRISQDANRKLRDVALQLVTTRKLPD